MGRKRKRGAHAANKDADRATEFPNEPAVVRVDGSLHEGGGQMVRTAIGLGSALRVSVEVNRVRAGRRVPGLRAQHVAGAELTAAVGGGKLYGANVRSCTLRFVPGDICTKKEFEAPIRTAGAAALVLQAALPSLIEQRSKISAKIGGGTHVPASPTSEYVAYVLSPTLKFFGVDMVYDVRRRGFFPRGGGMVHVDVDASNFGAWRCTTRTRVSAIRGYIVPGGHDLIEAAEHMRDAVDRELKAKLGERYEEATGVNVVVVPVESGANSANTLAITLIAETIDGPPLGASSCTPVDAPRDGTQFADAAIELGKTVVCELVDDLTTGAAVDRHMADQIAVLMALARGESCVSAPAISMHMKSVQEVIGRFGVSIEFQQGEHGMWNLVCSGKRDDA